MWHGISARRSSGPRTLGRILFPYVGAEFGILQFSALEAVLSTTVGFGIYTAFFG